MSIPNLALKPYLTLVCIVDFERLTPYVKDLSKKQTITSQSLQKIEDGNNLEPVDRKVDVLTFGV
jgi:hypothetical protein